MPEVYGDPALLLPKLIPNTVTKKYELGIIPHYVDYEKVVQQFSNDPKIKVINLMTDDIVKTTHEILTCKKIISSSLHGVIVSQAYHIPALWVKFSNKLAGDNVKFYDYFESIGLHYPNEIDFDSDSGNFDSLMQLLDEHNERLLPNLDLLTFRQDELLKSCPFYNEKRR